MRPAHCQILHGALRQAALALERIAAPIPGTGAATTVAVTRSGVTSWLESLLLGPHGSPGGPFPGGGVASFSTRGLCSSAHPPPDSSARNESSSNLASASPSGSDCSAVSTSSSSSASNSASPPRQQQAARGKSSRHHARAASAGPVQPAARGAKDKAAKVPSAKAAAAMAAAKAGGQQPLPREARLQLDAQLAEMPLPPPLHRGRAAEGPRTVQVTGFYIGHPFTRASAEAAAARFRSQPLARGVAVAGVYHDHEDALIVLHHLPEAQAHAHASREQVAAAPAPTVTGAGAGVGEQAARPALGLSTDFPTAAASAATGAERAETAAAPMAFQMGSQEQELAGEAVAAVLGPGHGPEQAGADLTAAGLESEAVATADASSAGGAALGPLGRSGGEGDSNGQDASCMAVMLLEYGGVVFFNVPEPLHAAALARVAAAALPDLKLAAAVAEAPLPVQLAVPRQQPLRPGGRADTEGWQQAVAEKLSVHKEEQLIVVDPNMMAGRGTGRWIRKLDDSLRIWSWDSTNLEGIARVLSQSAAIRYYNQACEDMLERYETIMPLGYEPPDRLSWLDRLLFWRSRLPLRDLRQMVFKSSGIRVRLDSRLGLRDPPSGTWESARHHAVWDAMRREFELDERRDNLMEKTDLLKQSCLDLISANNESFTKRSELSIILLISVEILINLTDLHNALSAENIGRAAGWALQAMGMGPGAGAGGGAGASGIMG